MGFDYNKFTKAELVSFLNKYGDDFKYITKPYLIILEEKMKNIMNEIYKINDNNEKLLERLKIQPDKTTEIYLEIMANNKRWNLLYQEHDKLSEIA